MLKDAGDVAKDLNGDIETANPQAGISNEEEPTDMVKSLKDSEQQKYDMTKV